MLVSLNPVTGIMRDSYEAITGKNLITGEELDEFGRSIAVVGVITFGFGSEIAKGISVLGKLAKETAAFEHAAKSAERILGTAQRIGIRTSEQLGKTMGMLREASQGKGLFNLGKSTRKEAQFLGEAWVGPGFRKRPYRGHPGHEMLVSEDGLKVFRPAVYKDRVRNSGVWQTFEPSL